jgi:nitroimidazol reductase NimA-like FMN-containing flavoprotein (pyridoxamine 5'-phosphate oxidase superfamily)
MTATSVPREGRIRELPEDECMTRLRSATVGRIAFCTPAGPVILPVNFVLDGGAVVVRTTPYSMLAGHIADPIAFEVDDLDHDERRGWSVLVAGDASQIDDPDDIVEGEFRSRLTPWAPGSRNLFVRITPRSVTGREISV